MFRLSTVVTCFFLFIGVVAADNMQPRCEEHHCIAVVDAGSTGSRVHLFEYDFDDNHNPKSIHEFWSHNVTPGFSSLELNQESIDAYLDHLFSGAPHVKAPVYFYATAGMRLLSKTTQTAYYQKLQHWFDAQTKWQLIEGKTITGQDEGLYGWLAANYQLGNFDSADKPLVSVMDMGGASVQIVFPVKQTDSIPAADLVRFDRYNRHVRLYVHSFLGLGLTEAMHQILDSVSCFSDGYELSNGMLAEGDAKKCRKQATRLVNAIHMVKARAGKALLNNPVNDWYVVGGLGMLAQDNLFDFTGGEFSVQQLFDKADGVVCHQSWKTLIEQYPNHKYLYGYCFASSYYYSLLVDGYGINSNQEIHYLDKNKSVNGWVLGVVLQQH